MENKLEFRWARMDDAARCFEIEAAAYAEDEAATLAKIATRIEGYPEGFLILELGGTIVGFINSGCAHEVEMSDDAFKELIGHDAEARDVVIMSVVLDPDFQGRGLATSLMTEFVTRMKAAGKEQIHLMCKENYRPLYERFGYKFTKPSRSTHGGAQWYEMVMNLTF